MNPSEIKTKIARVLAEKFLSDLEATTEVDSRFIDTARPVITKLFSELPEERQALLMYLLKQSAVEQRNNPPFDTDKLASFTMSPSDVNIHGLEKIKRQVHYIHGVVANTLLSSYGGLGEQKIAVEG
jgi:hypothetical protein